MAVELPAAQGTTLFPAVKQSAVPVAAAPSPEKVTMELAARVVKAAVDLVVAPIAVELIPVAVVLKLPEVKVTLLPPKPREEADIPERVNAPDVPVRVNAPVVSVKPLEAVSS